MGFPLPVPPLSTLLGRFPGLWGVRPHPALQPFPTGIASLDQLLGGGIPRATLTEISGAPSTGKTTLVLSLLAHATAAGHCCALVDASDTFDPRSAAQAGVQLARLLWIRCRSNAEHALKAADLMVQAGGLGLIILDLGDIPCRSARRISLTSWFRLRHAAQQNSSTLVAVARRFHAASCSRLQLELRRERFHWSGKRFDGCTVAVTSRKHYLSRPTSFLIPFEA